MESTSRALAVCGAPAGVRTTRRLHATAQRASQPRACVWIEARHFFSRADAQQYCWLWLLGGDGRVHALRLPAERLGDDHVAKSLLARSRADPDAPIPSTRRFGPACPLPGAPVVPLPRWSVSWGHPLQQAIHAFAVQLDAQVLMALGQLKVPGPFFGSISNYNRLALLPPTVRAHRLQALREFPPLVAPLLLDTFDRPDMFGTDEDEPQGHARRDAEIAHVLDAMDRGRDLVGALAGHYGIGRALARSPLLREPWAAGGVSRDVLRLLDAIRPQARPRDRASLEPRLPYLRALPLRIRTRTEVHHLAGAFAGGWDGVWRAVEASSLAPATALRDTRDFLREAIAHAAATMTVAPPAMEPLALAWLARLGPRSLLEASRRWHAQPLIVDPGHDGLPDVITPLFDRFEYEGGVATELTTRHALIEEGEAMHHCVGGYWRECVQAPVRIAHLATRSGATATALYRFAGAFDTPRLQRAELRGPCNAAVGTDEDLLGRRLEACINADARAATRRQIAAEATLARAMQRTGPDRRDQRPLDRKSRAELRKVLAWADGHLAHAARPPALLRGTIAGFAHGEGPRLLAQLAPGDALELVREPANPHDPRAVRIDWSGHKLGYVPRTENVEIARQLDAGIALCAAITAVGQDREDWNPIEIEIAKP